MIRNETDTVKTTLEMMKVFPKMMAAARERFIDATKMLSVKVPHAAFQAWLKSALQDFKAFKVNVRALIQFSAKELSSRVSRIERFQTSAGSPVMEGLLELKMYLLYARATKHLVEGIIFNYLQDDLLCELSNLKTEWSDLQRMVGSHVFQAKQKREDAPFRKDRSLSHFLSIHAREDIIRFGIITSILKRAGVLVFVDKKYEIAA